MWSLGGSKSQIDVFLYLIAWFQSFFLELIELLLVLLLLCYSPVYTMVYKNVPSIFPLVYPAIFYYVVDNSKALLGLWISTLVLHVYANFLWMQSTSTWVKFQFPSICLHLFNDLILCNLMFVARSLFCLPWSYFHLFFLERIFHSYSRRELLVFYKNGCN